MNYLEIDLLGDYVINSIVIQGRRDNGIGTEFASHFKVMFSRNGFSDFVEYRHDNGEILLKGNLNPFDSREQHLNDMLVIAAKLRYEKENISVFCIFVI